MISQTFDNPPETASDSFEHGHQAAERTTVLPPRGHIFPGLGPDHRQTEAIVRRGRRLREEERIIRTAAKEIRDLGRYLRFHSVARNEAGKEMPRACAVAND